MKFVNRLILLFICLTQSVMAQTPGLHLESILKKIYTVQANFSQRTYSGRNKLVRAENGSMAISRPGKFRWDITSPSPMLMVTAGKLLWIYDKKLAQASAVPVKKGIGSTPASILSGATNMLTNYFIVNYSDGWYFMRPRYANATNIKMVKLKFNGTALARMQISDNLGQYSDLTFSNVRINQSIPAALFQFSPPRGVDIIRQ